MVKVALWGSLRTATGGAEIVEIDASNFKEVLDALIKLHPGLEPQIERGVSMAIDGVIFKESWFTPVSPNSEVVLMPYMTGG